MFTLEVNKQPMTYQLYVGKTDKLDASGYKTGEKTITYANEVPFKGCISPASGSARFEPFGTFRDYTHALIVSADLGITEESLIHFAGEVYTVKKIAKSLNHTIYALQLK